MFFKRNARALMRTAVGAALGGTLFIGSCEADALNAVVVGLDAAVSTLDRGNNSDRISFEDFIRSQLD